MSARIDRIRRGDFKPPPLPISRESAHVSEVARAQHAQRRRRAASTWGPCGYCGERCYGGVACPSHSDLPALEGPA